MTNGFTKTEQAILQLLSDGGPHKRDDIKALLPDELAELSQVYWHVSNLRKKLESRGETIVCERANRCTHYRHVRLLKSPYDGLS